MRLSLGLDHTASDRRWCQEDIHGSQSADESWLDEQTFVSAMHASIFEAKRLRSSLANSTRIHAEGSMCSRISIWKLAASRTTRSSDRWSEGVLKAGMISSALAAKRHWKSRQDVAVLPS